MVVIIDDELPPFPLPLDFPADPPPPPELSAALAAAFFFFGLRRERVPVSAAVAVGLAGPFGAFPV